MSSNDIYMITDIPAPSDQDLLHFERYLSPLFQIITNPQSQTPFTIGIFGSWGSGKSTLLQHLDEKLKERKDSFEFFRIIFNPWIYREDKNLIVPLLHTIHDSLDQYPGGRFVETAKKIGSVLTRIGAALLLKTVTANQITLKDIEDQGKAYMEQHRRSESVIRNLRKKLQEVINEITEDGKSGRVVFFIDDLDRCEPDQIIGLLEAIKLFLDLKYCFFILALDDEVIHKGIQIKYANFEFVEDRKERIGQEYLEKMIQLPLYLYPLSEGEIQNYLAQLSLPPQVMEHAALFAGCMFPNPRKIKRILNLFLLNLAVLQNDKSLSELIKKDVLARLVVIQVQDYDLYRAILKNPDFPEYLSKVYREQINIHNVTEWAVLGDRRDDIRKLCTRYYRPAGWLEHIFKPDNVFPRAKKLEPYFNMLGSRERL